MKCESCKIFKEENESSGLAICAWYLENVVCGSKTVEECDEYEGL